MPTWCGMDLAGECGADTEDAARGLAGDDSVEGEGLTGDGGIDAVGGSLLASLTALSRDLADSLRKDGNGRGAAAKGEGMGR